VDKPVEIKVGGMRALVTGGSRGMGFEWAKLLLKDKAHVVLMGQNLEALLKAQKELRLSAKNQTIDILSVDLRDEGALRDQLQTFLKGNQVDILVNNAGVVHRGKFVDVPFEDHRDVIAVNILGVMSITHMVLKTMIARHSGSIVNIASMAGLTGVPHMASYVASKWAVIGFTESLRLEMQEAGLDGIKFMTFCPSYVQTGMFRGAKPPFLSRWLNPADTVQKAYNGFKRGKTLVIDPEIAHLIPLARSLLPTVINDKVWQILGIHKSSGLKD
jgi:short-subunit dehydrogenase